MRYKLIHTYVRSLPSATDIIIWHSSWAKPCQNFLEDLVSPPTQPGYSSHTHWQRNCMWRHQVGSFVPSGVQTFESTKTDAWWNDVTWFSAPNDCVELCQNSKQMQTTHGNWNEQHIQCTLPLASLIAGTDHRVACDGIDFHGSAKHSLLQNAAMWRSVNFLREELGCMKSQRTFGSVKLGGCISEHYSVTL